MASRYINNIQEQPDFECGRDADEDETRAGDDHRAGVLGRWHDGGGKQSGLRRLHANDKHRR